MKRNTMDNGATVLDILGGDNYLGLGRSSLSGQSMSEIFPQYQRENIGVEARYHPPVEIPKEMKEFTIDQQKNMIAFSGSHFRLPAAVAGFRQTRGTAAGKRILSTAAFPAGRFRSTRQFRLG